jgi:hypothetical protein
MDDERTDDNEVTDMPAATPANDDPADREADAAGREAAGIGGPHPRSDADEAHRPLEEAGEGEAEGFELAERDLEEHATHGDPGVDPTTQAGRPEESEPRDYGEADDVVKPDGPGEGD